jgi:hypothetical protein
MWIEQFQEHPAVLDEIVSYLAGPENLNQEAPIRLAVVLTGYEHTDFLALEVSRADQPNARRRNVAAEELNFAVVWSEDSGGLNERNAAVLAALQLDGSHFIVVNDSPDGLLNLTLLLTVAWACLGNGDVIVSALPVMKKGMGQG